MSALTDSVTALAAAVAADAVPAAYEALQAEVATAVVDIDAITASLTPAPAA